MPGALGKECRVVGTGAAGMAFTDTLLGHSDATVTPEYLHHAAAA
jgi:hypothetical protein